MTVADFKVAVVAADSDADFAALITNAGEIDGGAAAAEWPRTIRTVYGPTNATWDSLQTGTVGNESTYLQSDGVVNDHLEYLLQLPEADDYVVGLSHHKGTNRGIYTVRKGPDINNLTTLGTVDGYNAGGTQTGQRGTLTGISFTGEAEILQIIMATKNAGSSSFFGLLESIYIYRPPT